jgi:hypothetical protein
MASEDQEMVALPTKRLDNDSVFKLPHPSATPMMQRRLKLKTKKVLYDEDLLLKKFGTAALANVIVNDNYTYSKGASRMNGFTWQYLKKNFILPLNNSEQLGCFLTNNGALAIFSPPLEDIKTLNSLLSFLLEKLKVNHDAHTKVEFDVDKPLFIRGDCMTSYWNKEGNKMISLPSKAFQGKVALKVMGLMYYESCNGSGFPNVKLSIHLDQVKVLDEGIGNDELIKDCIFN